MPGSVVRAIAAGVLFAASFNMARAGEPGPTLQAIKDAGVIAIGFREGTIPLSYADANGQPQGLALDLCGAVAAKIKEKLGAPDLKITFQAVSASEAASLLEKGSLALDCGATPVAPELEKRVSFSAPIFVSELTWLVPRRLRVEREGRRRTRIETIEPLAPGDLKNKTVALTRGSPAIPAVLTLSNDQTLGLSIVEGKDNAEAFKLLETGKASALIADNAQLAALKATAKNPDAFGFFSGGYPGASYAFMFRKDDAEFSALAGGVLADALKSGEYAKLYAKWFESPIPPKNVNLAYPMPMKLKEALGVREDKPAGQ